MLKTMSYKAVHDAVVNELGLLRLTTIPNNTHNLMIISNAIKKSIVGCDKSRYVIAIMVEHMVYPNMILNDKSIIIDELHLEFILGRIQAAKTKKYMATILPLNEWEKQVMSIIAGPKQIIIHCCKIMNNILYDFRIMKNIGS